MLTSISVAAGPWSQLSILSLNEAMRSSEEMVSIKAGEWRCGIYFVDHVLRRDGRITFSTFSRVLSKPSPFSGRKPSSLTFSLSTYGFIPENALSSPSEERKEAMVFSTTASYSFLVLSSFANMDGKSDITAAYLSDDLLKDGNSLLEILV